jgi:hypothetical protein
MCDGRLNDSSFGIRRAATNLFRRGQCDSTLDLTGANAGGITFATDAAVPAPFSPQSIKVTADGSAPSQGIQCVSATGQAAAAGVVGAGSIWFKGNAGETYWTSLRWGNTDATTTVGPATSFVGTGNWQLVTAISAPVAAGKTGDQLRIAAYLNGTTAEVFHAAHAMLEKGQSVVAPYVATSGGATATHAAGRVRAPTNLIDTTQSWVAVRLRVSFPSTASLSANPFVFSVDDGTSNNRLLLFWNYTNVRWETRRIAAGAAGGITLKADAFAAGDFRTLILRWDAGTIAVSVNGAPFVSVASVGTFSPTTFNIGTDGNGAGQIDSDVFWTASGTGTLSDAEAATLHGYGNAGPTDIMALPGAAQLLWGADTSTAQRIVAFTSTIGTFTIGSIAIGTPTLATCAAPTPSRVGSFLAGTQVAGVPKIDATVGVAICGESTLSTWYAYVCNSRLALQAVIPNVSAGIAVSVTPAEFDLGTFAPNIVINNGVAPAGLGLGSFVPDFAQSSDLAVPDSGLALSGEIPDFQISSSLIVLDAGLLLAASFPDYVGPLWIYPTVCIDDELEPAGSLDLILNPTECL